MGKDKTDRVRKAPDHGILKLAYIAGADGSLNVFGPEHKNRDAAWKWLKTQDRMDGTYCLVRLLESRTLTVVTTPRMVLEQTTMFKE